MDLFLYDIGLRHERVKSYAYVYTLASSVRWYVGEYSPISHERF